MYNRYAPHQGFQPLEPEPDVPFLRRLLGNEKNAGLTGILEKLGLPQPDKGDVLLVLLLIVLYRESEDQEWLIILALVLVMGLD